MNFADDLDGVRRGALLGSHLHLLAVLAHGLEEQRTFSRVVATGLFYIDVLASLQSVDGHWGVPVIGRGDGDGVDVFLFENLAEVFAGCGRVAHRLLHGGGEFCEGVAVDVADVRDAGGVLICLERGEMRVGAAVKADDGEVEAVIGAEDLAVTLRR